MAAQENPASRRRSRTRPPQGAGNPGGGRARATAPPVPAPAPRPRGAPAAGPRLCPEPHLGGSVRSPRRCCSKKLSPFFEGSQVPSPNSLTGGSPGTQRLSPGNAFVLLDAPQFVPCPCQTHRATHKSSTARQSRDAPGSLELGAKHLRATRMENTMLPPAVDVDKGFTMVFVVLVCLFLLAVAMRYAKLIVDPYSAFSDST
ncbi:cortexin domain containing 2 [Mergus octosetaceus]